MGDKVDDTEHLVNKYFAYGFSQKDILAYLKFLHNKCISARTLKRILSRLKLYRRKNYSRFENVVNFLRQEITKSGQLQGYRWMHLRCIQNNLVVTQDIVRELLWLLDPEGVETRKRKRLRRRQYFNKGPNYLWHVDSYDKLKPFGICINGCIDGFSRHIIWLRAGITSSDPKVIGGYFLDGIKMIGGCPETLRCDMGTENTCIEKIQKSLHELFGIHML
ncbi:uncharacterized protein [Leptinotarsa decemlineata]|uniref:uncharacterized protein n=1 Tax=Leptinotarsa decemlineata TaxID=7539 RepID=UPI003D30BB79